MNCNNNIHMKNQLRSFKMSFKKRLNVLTVRKHVFYRCNDSHSCSSKYSSITGFGLCSIVGILPLLEIFVVSVHKLHHISNLHFFFPAFDGKVGKH